MAAALLPRARARVCLLSFRAPKLPARVWAPTRLSAARMVARRPARRRVLSHTSPVRESARREGGAPRRCRERGAGDSRRSAL